VSVRVGDIVLKRSIYGGNVRWTFPHRIAGEWDGRLGIYCGAGNRGKAMRRGPEGYLKRWVTDAPPFDTTWEGGSVLRFERVGAAHSVEIFWDENWGLRGWYVNLQAPLVVNGRCLDTTDLALDVTVDPDGRWAWKDEDELVEAISLGVLDEAAAADLRAEGERVIAAKPWPTGWEDWRPPPDWGPLPLPVDWHVV
jgi:hypothetical protein